MVTRSPTALYVKLLYGYVKSGFGPQKNEKQNLNQVHAK
jgi:hypothetical protein